MGFFSDLLFGGPSGLVWLTSLSAFWATLAFAALLSLVSTLATKFLVNLELVKSATTEYSAWMKEVRKAQKEGDRQKVEKLMKRQRAITAQQSRAQLERFKVFPVTIVPFYLVFDILTTAFTGNVAFSPVFIPLLSAENSFLGVFGWYLIGSFALGVPLSKLFGIYPERD